MKKKIQKYCRILFLNLLLVFGSRATLYADQGPDYISFKVNPGNVEITWKDFKGLPEDWIGTKARKLLDAGADSKGYLVYVEDAGAPKEAPKGLSKTASRTFYAKENKLILSQFQSNHFYTVRVAEILADAKAPWMATKVGIGHNKMHSNNLVSLLRVPAEYVPTRVSETASHDLKTSLKDIYDAPDQYLGKLVQVEGFFDTRGSALRKKARASIGSALTRSDGEISDGNYRLHVFGLFAATDYLTGKENPENYCELTGFLVKHPGPGSTRPQKGVGDKPDYLFVTVDLKTYQK